MEQNILKNIIRRNVHSSGISHESNFKCRQCHEIIGKRCCEILGPNFNYYGLTSDGNGSELIIKGSKRDCVIKEHNSEFSEGIIEAKFPTISIKKNWGNNIKGDFTDLVCLENEYRTAAFVLVPDKAPVFKKDGSVDYVDENIGKYSVKKFNEIIDSYKYDGLIFLGVYFLDGVKYNKIASKEEYDSILATYDGPISFVNLKKEKHPHNLIINDFDQFSEAFASHIKNHKRNSNTEKKKIEVCEVINSQTFRNTYELGEKLERIGVELKNSSKSYWGL